MVTVKPFAALRPDPALASRLCELPYDVVSSAEARSMAADNPLSFFHVSKPEIDLPLEIDVYSERVYGQGRLNFRNLIAERALRQDGQPGFYLYRQVMGKHEQLGLVAVTSCDEYLKNVIKKHELTRPDKENDRVRHIESLNAQTGPAFLVYHADPVLDEHLELHAAAPPEIDFVANDGVRHSTWTISDARSRSLIQSQFGSMAALYIADGHHRSAAAARVFQKRPGAEATGFFLSVLFPHDQVQILPYHRVIKDLHGVSAQQLLQKLECVCDVRKMGAAQPVQRHEVSLYLEGVWYTLVFRLELASTQGPIEQLDVTLLQKLVLAPLLGIDDPRTSARINFVGGIRGTVELERLVDSQQYACAFSLFPTSIADLIRVADSGGLMPPKSTWFEPKLRDGLFCHLLD